MNEQAIAPGNARRAEGRDEKPTAIAEGSVNQEACETANPEDEEDEGEEETRARGSRGGSASAVAKQRPRRR
jgi:hypothetical protein